MEKFTRINEEFNFQPTKEQKELDALKVSILKLMEKCLTIRANGTTRRDLLGGSVSISGKEMFTNALIDLLSDKSFQDQIKALESLKTTNRDWESIDEKIDQLMIKRTGKKDLIENINQVKNIKGFLNNYSSDDRFEEILENHCQRINNSDLASIKSKVALLMSEDEVWSSSKDKLVKLSEKFLERYNQLNQNASDNN